MSSFNVIPGTGIVDVYSTLRPIDLSSIRNATDPRIATTPGGVVRVNQGQTTLDKILQTALQSVALLRGAQYIPTEEVPAGLYGPQYSQSPYPYPYPTQPISDGSTGATFGASIESFLRNNTGLIAIGLIGYMLLMSGRK